MREINVIETDYSGNLTDFRKIYFQNIKKDPSGISICCGESWFSHRGRKLNSEIIVRGDPNAVSTFF